MLNLVDTKFPLLPPPPRRPAFHSLSEIQIQRAGWFATLCFLLLATSVWSGQAEDALNEGLKLHEAGNPKEAIQEYDRAIKANPKLAEAYFNRGNAYYDLGENQQAVRDYGVAIRLNPKDAEALYNRGNSYRRLKQDSLAQ